jgi:hypothetical protein
MLYFISFNMLLGLILVYYLDAIVSWVWRLFKPLPVEELSASGYTIRSAYNLGFMHAAQREETYPCDDFSEALRKSYREGYDAHAIWTAAESSKTYTREQLVKLVTDDQFNKWRIEIPTGDILAASNYRGKDLDIMSDSELRQEAIDRHLIFRA